MLWTFYRDCRHVSYEIRLSAYGPGYELVVRLPDGSERLERFDDSNALNRRALEVQWNLVADGWWSANHHGP